LSHSA